MASPSDHDDTFNRNNNVDERIQRVISNPLALPYPWWHELYKRIKLVPWWVSYNLGTAREAELKNKIIDLANSMGLQDNWVKRLVRHAVSEFSKKGLGPDYYGYHTIDHELEATYFTLLVAKGLKSKKKLNDQDIDYPFELEQQDIKYLFVAALFHDFDPLKEFDKPNEDYVEWFLRHDNRIREFMEDVGVSIDLVMALIHRTAYPFVGENRERAIKRMQALFTSAGIPESDLETRKHFGNLGWFLSVSERMAGYTLGDFDKSTHLAERNAHALGWHASVINFESVKYFSVLKEEKEMIDLIMEAIPEEYRKRYNDNVASFHQAWQKQQEIQSLILKNQIRFVPVVEVMRNEVERELEETLFRLYFALPPPIRVEKGDFQKSLARRDTLLVTLRISDNHGAVVGYAKGGPLEHYKLRRGTHDENVGKGNTIYLEPISIEQGYWGGRGGPILRRTFLNEAKKRGYKFVSAYVHRNMIERRMTRGEPVQIVCRYDPDRLDYYRVALAELPPADVFLSTITAQERLEDQQNL